MDAQQPVTLYAIYERPKDYPEGYVLREWLITPTEGPQPGSRWRAKSLDEAHAILHGLREGLNLVEWPGGEPDPRIIEVWM